VVAALAAAGCVTSQTLYYVPTAGDSRLNTAQMKDQSDAFLRSQCPRLLEGNSTATGEARLMAEIDRSGAVQKARIVRTSGDQAMDDIFGALVARLQFDPPSNMNGETGSHPIYVGYSCSPEMAVTTLNITGDPTPPLPPRTIPPAT
jgi:TonB family protein